MVLVRPLRDPVSAIEGLLESAAEQEHPQVRYAPIAIVKRRADELYAHPCFARLNITPAVSEASGLAEDPTNDPEEPLMITEANVVIDGYAQWALARLMGEKTVLTCAQYRLSETEALRFLIHRNHRSRGLNDFCRILLALELEPSLAMKARVHQHAGGKYKASSKLTRAESIDVRRKIARIAGVSVGNVTKVKQLIVSADPKIIEALTNGRIRIHRAWLWRGEPPQRQRHLLLDRITEAGVKKKIRELISRHQPPAAQAPLHAAKLATLLSSANPKVLHDIKVTCVKTSGLSIHISQDLLNELDPRFPTQGSV